MYIGRYGRAGLFHNLEISMVACLHQGVIIFRSSMMQLLTQRRNILKNFSHFQERDSSVE
jgi:hypothetical protein